jgi:hypothetical protein
MFGKKIKMNGPWDDITSRQLELIAENLILTVKSELGENKQIEWKDFEKKINETIRDAASLVWKNADTNGSKSLERILANSPFSSFTSTVTTTSPEKDTKTESKVKSKTESK